MTSLILTSTLLIIISTMLMTIASLISKKSMLDREKMSPFECGFDPFSTARIPFSLRFFLIAVIFLIFDVEIALLLPMMKVMYMSKIQSWIIVSVIFILILLIGLFHEWKQGALEWTN
uniref:NADH dehydrogenase subunit 3 n=1 Tax=Davidius fruhstorferi TaxID=638472 RepID=UPI0023F00621|nr:NADH dehydrogenase subunit 3 [Davidius fruhstorferi]WDY83500.1 NADH dehydrogenase subunit 3 [Davidius fruhstorferi]